MENLHLFPELFIYFKCMALPLVWGGDGLHGEALYFLFMFFTGIADWSASVVFARPCEGTAERSRFGKTRKSKDEGRAPGTAGAEGGQVGTRCVDPDDDACGEDHQLQ